MRLEPRPGLLLAVALLLARGSVAAWFDGNLPLEGLAVRVAVALVAVRVGIGLLNALLAGWGRASQNAQQAHPRRRATDQPPDGAAPSID